MGVFVFGGLLLSCDEGPTEPTLTPSGQGFVWAYTEYFLDKNWLMKIDVVTGDVFHRGVAGFEMRTRPVGIPADVDTGEFFLHRDCRFIAKYNAEGERVWETGVIHDLFYSLGYYKKGEALWAFGGDGLKKYDADNGEYILTRRNNYLRSSDIPIQVDQRDGAVWAASAHYFLKISSRGDVLYDEHYEGVDHTIANMAIDERDGKLWIVVHDLKPHARDRLIKYGPDGKKLHTKVVFAHTGGPDGMAVDPANGDVWMGYKNGVVVHDVKGDYKKLLPHYDRVRAFAFAGNRVILAGGEDIGYFSIQAINKSTGKEFWRKYSKVTPGVVRICYTEK